MTDANYLAHCKNLGKIVHIYDSAAASEATLKLGAVRWLDQFATGEISSSYAIAGTWVDRYNSLRSAITAGPVEIQAWCKTAASAYLQSDAFLDTLGTTPTSESDTADILDAWATDMTADSKTFTTESSTGFVNFFTANWTTMEETFPQAAAESATHPDATYVVATIV